MRDLLLLDFETSGLESQFHDPNGSDPIQLAAVRLDGTTLAEKAAFCSLIRPERIENANEHAMRIHGIPVETLLAAPRTVEVLRGFEAAMFGPERALSVDEDVVREMASEVTLVAQYLVFDHGFLDLMYRRAGLSIRRLGRDQICTRILGRIRARSGAFQTADDSVSMDAQLAAFGMEARQGAHDAMDDVRLMAEVLRRHEAELRAAAYASAELAQMRSFLEEHSPSTLLAYDRQAGRPQLVLENAAAGPARAARKGAHLW